MGSAGLRVFPLVAQQTPYTAPPILILVLGFGFPAMKLPQD
jgi:hypothetical protein